MSVLSDYVERMVDGGMDVDDAMQVAAELFAAGVASAAVRPSAGALRMRKLRHKASQSVTSDGEQSETESVTKRHKASHVVTSDKVPISTSNIIKESKRHNRGTRLSVDWSPSDAERAFAKQQGYSDFEVGREIDKFRDYWAACAGAKGVKLDWSATWRQWVRNGAERAGKTPLPATGGPAPAGFYAKADSEQLAAWDTWNLKERRKGMPRDRNGGWRVDAEWPPGYVPSAKTHDQRPAPILRAM